MHRRGTKIEKGEESYAMNLINKQSSLSPIQSNSIQFNSIYLCAKLNSPEANYKVCTGKKMGRVRSKKESENNVLIKIK
jgi:hypothetical protein